MMDHSGHRTRLRSRFLEHGLDVLPDHEVLELLLFYALPRKDTNLLARQLLDHFGTIAAVLEAPLEELKSVAGIGENAAVLLHLITPLSRRYLLSRTEKNVCLSTSKDCGEYLLPYFFGATEEQVYLLCLDAKCKVLACRLLQSGSVNSALVPLRKAAEVAMACNASAVILAHNHTSGLALPSRADIEVTEQLRAALEPLEIKLVDHIIVADGEYVSMMDSNRFDP